MPDQSPSQDPYEQMLSGGHLGPISHLAREYLSLKSGAAFDMARDRYQTQQVHLDQINKQIEGWAGSGLESPFTPELQKYYKSIGGAPELWDAAKGQASAFAARRQSVHDQLFGQKGSAMAGSAPGTTTGANGTGGSSPPPMAAGSSPSPAPTSADPTAQMLAPGTASGTPSLGAAPTQPTLAMGADGSPDWANHDWQAHGAAEPDYLKQQYAHLQDLGRALMDASGLPEEKPLGEMYKNAATEHSRALENYYGFQKSSALEEQRAGHEMERVRYTQGQAGARHVRTKIDAEAQSIGKAITDAQTKLLGPSGSTDPATVEPIVKGLNQRLKALRLAWVDAGSPGQDPTKALQVKMKTIPGGEHFWSKGPTGQIEPDTGAEDADLGATPSAKKIEQVDPLEGRTISAPGKPTLIRKGGKWVALQEANAQ